MSAIEFQGLSKSYRDFFGRRRVKALDGLSLSIPKGEVFGLIGPNGSGKTTTFKIAVGLLRPDSGSAHIDGQPAGSMRARRATGYLPEESSLLQFLTARETVRFYGALAGLNRRDAAKKTDELLERVGLSDAANRRAKGFSKGMQRRLGIASVLIGDPDVFILDEPTSGLDPLGSVEMKQLIAELRDAGKAVLISSHLLGEMENICDRVAFLYQGKILKKGTLEELLRDNARHQMRITDGNQDAIRKLEQSARDLGLSIESSGSPMKSLEQFYLEMLADKPDPGP